MALSAWDFDSFDSLLFEFHFLVEKVLISKESIKDGFDVSHPVQGHFHLQIFILQLFLFLFELLVAFFLLF